MVKTAEEKKEAQRGYVRKYREKYNVKIQNANDKVREIESVICGCGGNYKDIKQNRERHFETSRHCVWDEKINKVMPMFIEVGKTDTLEEADQRIEAYFKKNRKFSAAQQIIVLDTFTRQILNQLGGKSVSLDAYYNRSVEPVKKPTKTKLEAHHENVVKICKEQEKKTPPKPKRETHHERIIRIAAETQESSSSEEEPQNEIIEAQKIIPPTPCPSSSEAESEETEETETETESESEEESEEESEKSKQLRIDKERAIKRFNRFKDAEAVEKESEPDKEIDMSSYLEEASKPTTDGSEILRQLGILKKTKTGGEKYTYV